MSLARNTRRWDGTFMAACSDIRGQFISLQSRTVRSARAVDFSKLPGMLANLRFPLVRNGDFVIK